MKVIVFTVLMQHSVTENQIGMLLKGFYTEKNKHRFNYLSYPTFASISEVSPILIPPSDVLVWFDFCNSAVNYPKEGLPLLNITFKNKEQCKG